jgi:uncharacterized protein YdeI (YjbR/CyaY-like superfamily)
MNPKVDTYISSLKNWREEVELIREILLTTNLEEGFKWSKPCYTYNGKNILGIATLKEHCALNIFNGASLSDPNEILMIPGEHSQSARWMKFENKSAINKYSKIIKAFVKQAIELEATGVNKIKTVAPKLNCPEELENIFKKDAKLKTAFYALTPGRQRAYLIFFTAPKQAETRVTRIKKYTPKILCGKGFNDCTCGFSKRMPNCDGSHKFH